MLLNFLIIGMARSGKTFLYHHMRKHPDVFMALKKELQLFTRTGAKVPVGTKTCLKIGGARRLLVKIR